MRVELVDLGITGKERGAHGHLGEDAADGPDVDRGGVLAGAEQNLRGTIPQGDDLVGVVAHRDAEGAGEPEVGQLELAGAVDEQVLRLEVAVQDAEGVAVRNAVDELVKVRLDQHGAQHFHAVHEALEILVEKLEDEVQFLLLVHDILEADHVGVVQLLQDADLADGGRGHAWAKCDAKSRAGRENHGWKKSVATAAKCSERRKMPKVGPRRTFVLLLQANFLQRDDLAGLFVARAVNDAVCALANFAEFLVAVHGAVHAVGEVSSRLSPGRRRALAAASALQRRVDALEYLRMTFSALSTAAFRGREQERAREPQ